MPIVIDYSKCCWKDGKCSSCKCGGACIGCVEACPTGALTRKDNVQIDHSQCIECELCIKACKHDAISMMQIKN
jgi:Fe-S-cluster-containing hydrogenase component 2